MQAPTLKRILIVVPTLECGGLERNVAIICNNMDTSRYEVTLAVLNNANPFFRINNPGVTVIDLGITNVRKSLVALVRLSRKIRPDVILATANHLNLLFAIFKGAFPKQAKIVARESSIVSINSKYAKLPALYNRLLKMFYKRLDLIICQSAYMQDDLTRNYLVPKANTAIIYNPVDAPEVNETLHEPGMVAELFTVGRLSKEKGMDRLIRSCALLRIPFRFTIIGEGDQRSHLQKLIAELGLSGKVFLAGSNARPFTLIKGPAYFLMGSWYEGFPNAMMEALAAGIPVVAFNAPGGIAELLHNNENGILVEDGNEQAFADAIQRAVNMPFNRQQLKERTLQRFNINAVMEKWYEVFDGAK